MREFLVTRRAKITPEQAGLPTYGQRRVSGLRRTEVAQLAGVSIEYYTRLERGNIAGASDIVLEAIASALQLDEAEREHLFHLARAASESSTTRRRRLQPARQELRPSMARLLDAMGGVPAFIRNGRLDVLAINDLGRALYSPVFRDEHRPVNLARFCFLDPGATILYPDWRAAADVAVALLRTEAGRNPHNRGLTDLVGELSTRSAEFSSRWAAHDVRLHQAGTKHFHHPVVGDLELFFDALDLPGQPGVTFTAYSAEPGSPADDGLKLLASWAASQSQDDPATAHRSHSQT